MRSSWVKERGGISQSLIGDIAAILWNQPVPDTPPSDAAGRNFLRGTAASGASIGLLFGCAPLAATRATAELPAATATAVAASDVSASARATIGLTVNRKRRTLTVEPRTTLVQALHDTLLGMTGTKIGCNHGQCGARTVLVDGR